MSYVAPLEDIRFLLRTVAPVADICSLPTFAHCDAELLFAVVEEGAKIARDVIAPLNAAADEPGARFENGNITTPPGFREAFTQLAADGWTSLAVPQDFGGQELPQLVNTIAAEMFAGACVAFQMALLTGSPAAKVIAAHGSDEQKTLWLPQIASGGAAATIVITEPQAGSDVGLIRTMATPQPDGAYAISGSKIFISQGDHDLTEQIVHLVLARTPGAAAGSRGLSLFLVPKRLPAAKGKPGARNSLRAARIEHKMGLSGSPTCEMVFEGATGTIIGHEGDGLRNLFAMMNAMRLDVAAQGVGVASAALRKAMAYVHERRQGAGRDGGPVAIVDHPDVRRNLLHMLAFTDGLRALLYMAAWHEDIATASGDRAVAKDAAAIVAFLLPLLKAGGSETAFDTASRAVQLHGGHGYVRDHGVEQLLRDSRVFAIYEGANAIQANDLVMRKVGGDKGATFRRIAGMIGKDIVAAQSQLDLTDVAQALATSLRILEQATDDLLSRIGTDGAYAAAPIYLQLAIETAVGWMWLKMAATEDEASRRRHRLLHARYMAQNVLIAAPSLLARIQSAGGLVGETSAADFQPWD